MHYHEHDPNQPHAVVVCLRDAWCTVVFPSEAAATRWAAEQAEHVRPNDWRRCLEDAGGDVATALGEWQYDLSAFDFLHVYPIQSPSDAAARVQSYPPDPNDGPYPFTREAGKAILERRERESEARIERMERATAELKEAER